MRLIKRVKKRSFQPSQESHTKESETFEDRLDISLLSNTEDQFRKSFHSNKSSVTLGKS